jgi:hypothetical protein
MIIPQEQWQCDRTVQWNNARGTSAYFSMDHTHLVLLETIQFSFML